MSDVALLHVTCADRAEAERIAEAVLAERLAACVNILPSVKSYYYYMGGTHLDEEVMLLIKTTTEQFDQVCEVITELHTYEIPEILMLRANAGSAPFLSWLQEAVARLRALLG